jgi:hypothetical protein
MNFIGCSNGAIKRYIRLNPNINKDLLTFIKRRAPNLLSRIVPKFSDKVIDLASEFGISPEKVEETIAKFHENEVSIRASLRAQRGNMLRKNKVQQ